MRNVNVNSVGEYIREQREQAKISMQQIAKGLRISAEALYVQAGILEDRLADSGVRSALLADPQLSERQKQVLVEIYESFRRENAADAKTGADAEADDPAELTVGSPGAEAEVLEAVLAAEAEAEAEANAEAEAKAGAKAGAQPAGDAQTVPKNRPDSVSD